MLTRGIKYLFKYTFMMNQCIKWWIPFQIQIQPELRWYLQTTT